MNMFLLPYVLFSLHYIIFKCCVDNVMIKYAEDSLQDTHGTIIYSSVIFRHGDRTPKTNYPTDPYPESMWGGFLQLTKKGKQKAYDLGKWYRKRYEKQIDGHGYSYKTMVMNSTDSDRTLMSGELFLAGMFPPNEDEMWADDGLKWQPIPVHMTPQENDRMAGASAPCERYDLEYNYWTSSPEIQEFYRKHQKAYDYICSNAGYITECSINDVFKASKHVWSVFNALTIQDESNLLLPSWTNKIYPEPARTISQFYFVSKTYSVEMRRLKGGPLVQNIISEMQQKRSGCLERLFHFYSAQETSLAIFLHTLDVYNNLIPNYTASVMIELREKDSEYYVTFLYRNTTEHPPYILQVPGCNDPCSLDKLIEVTEYLIPDNSDEECKVSFLERINYTIILSISVITLMFTVVAVSLMIFSRRRNRSSYKSLG